MNPTLDQQTCDRCQKSTQSVVEFFNSDGNRTRCLCEPCDQVLRLEEFEATGWLSTRLVREVSLQQARGQAHNLDIAGWIECLQSQMKVFEREVWFGGLQQMAISAKTRGLKAEEDDFTLMSYTLAGRAMITLEGKGASVTVIADETSADPSMGLQGIQATGDQAVGLFAQAMSLWNRGVRPVEDQEVSLGF